jgi:transcriptional regulator with XRE-family HTH domain
MGETVALGQRIRAARKRRRLTQEQLATAAGITRTTVQNIENGRTSEPYKVDEIAAALGIPVEELLTPAQDSMDLSTDKDRLIVMGDRDALDKLRRLDDRGRAIIMAALDAAVRHVGEDGP